MKFTVSQVSQLTKRSPKTIYNAVKSGRLSSTTDETGQKVIDQSEILRVYGPHALNESLVSEQITHSETQIETIEIAKLRHENESLKLKIESLGTVNAVLERGMDDLRMAMRLIEHKPTASQVKTTADNGDLLAWKILLALGLFGLLGYFVVFKT